MFEEMAYVCQHTLKSSSANDILNRTVHSEGYPACQPGSSMVRVQAGPSNANEKVEFQPTKYLKSAF